MSEAAIIGTARIGGSPTVVIILDFSFLGGSMGWVVGEKITLAMEQALKKKLPLIAVITSGGTRIQEGVLSLMQMAKTSTTAMRLHDAGLPFISVLANPATGQAYASFANLADIIIAEPGALVGLASLRSTREANAKSLPANAHTAESHLQHGLLDSVIDREQLRDSLSVLLDLLQSPFALVSTRKQRDVASVKTSPKTDAQTEAWQIVQTARHKERPTSRYYIDQILSGFVELHGDRVYGDDPTIVCGIGYIAGQGVAIVGQQPDADELGDGFLYPEGFRKARRIMEIAAKFSLPIITFIDTPGASPSLEAEERGLGHAIAMSMARMSQLPVPIISIVIGEGGSEAALAMGVADRILMQENAIYSPITPEAAAKLLYRDTTRANETSTTLRLTATDCKDLGIIDQIISEPEGGAHINPAESAHLLQRALMRNLATLTNLFTKQKPRRLVQNRQRKFRNMGEYSPHFGTAITKEITILQEYIATGIQNLRHRRDKKSFNET